MIGVQVHANFARAGGNHEDGMLTPSAGTCDHAGVAQGFRGALPLGDPSSSHQQYGLDRNSRVFAFTFGHSFKEVPDRLRLLATVNEHDCA
ncbi:MAG: hypothetical protein R3B13_01770 [Polyangiaceae bacterium]